MTNHRYGVVCALTQAISYCIPLLAVRPAWVILRRDRARRVGSGRNRKWTCAAANPPPVVALIRELKLGYARGAGRALLKRIQYPQLFL